MVLVRSWFLSLYLTTKEANLNVKEYTQKEEHVHGKAGKKACLAGKLSARQPLLKDREEHLKLHCAL